MKQLEPARPQFEQNSGGGRDIIIVPEHEQVFRVVPHAQAKLSKMSQRQVHRTVYYHKLFKISRFCGREGGLPAPSKGLNSICQKLNSQIQCKSSDALADDVTSDFAFQKVFRVEKPKRRIHFKPEKLEMASVTSDSQTQPETMEMPPKLFYIQKVEKRKLRKNTNPSFSEFDCMDEAKEQENESSMKCFKTETMPSPASRPVYHFKLFKVEKVRRRKKLPPASKAPIGQNPQTAFLKPIPKPSSTSITLEKFFSKEIKKNLFSLQKREDPEVSLPHLASLCKASSPLDACLKLSLVSKFTPKDRGAAEKI